MDTLLLPGMDGTGWLFRRLRLHLAPGLRLHTVEYPRTLPFTYEQMATHMKLPPGPFVLIAESFSGPLAIRIAQLRPTQVRAVVLVATFVRSPVGVAAHFAAWLAPLLAWLGLPAFAIRRVLLDATASDALVAEVAEAVRSVSGRVLASRLQEIASVNVEQAFKALVMPVLVIAAKHDRLVRPATVRTLIALRPDLKIEWLDGPHLILQMKPEAAAAAINSFLAPLI